MGSLQRTTSTTSATKFERTLRQCLVYPAENAFMFHQSWVDQHGGVDSAMIRRLSNLSDMPVFEFHGSYMTIDEFVVTLGGQPRRGSRHLIPIFRSLTSRLKKLRRGVVFINNAEKLNESITDLLDLLIVFVMQKKLPWKFVFLANTKRGLEYRMIQFSVDRCIGFVSSEPENGTRNADDPEANRALYGLWQFSKKAS